MPDTVKYFDVRTAHVIMSYQGGVAARTSHKNEGDDHICKRLTYQYQQVLQQQMPSVRFRHSANASHLPIL